MTALATKYGKQRTLSPTEGDVNGFARVNFRFRPGALVGRRSGSLLLETPLSASPRNDLEILGCYEAQTECPAFTDEDSGAALNADGRKVALQVRDGALGGFDTGSGANAIAYANKGMPCFAYDDNTLYLTDASGTLSFAGLVSGVDPDGKIELWTNSLIRALWKTGAIRQGKAELQFGTATELTIDTGEITVTQALHSVDTESDAASDNLDTVSGMEANSFYLLKPANGAHTVVIRHAQDNIYCPYAQNISLADATDWVLLMSDSTGANATVIAFSTLAANGGGAGAIVGLLSSLTTTDKTSVVAAINEVQAPVGQILVSRTATVGAKLTMAEGTDNGVNKVTVAAPNLLAGDVTVSLPSGDLDLANVPEQQGVDATLVNGTVTISSGIVVAATSEVIAFPKGAITGSTNFGCVRELIASRSVPGTVVIEAVGNDGALDNDAAGAIRVVILTPAG